MLSGTVQSRFPDDVAVALSAFSVASTNNCPITVNPWPLLVELAR